MCPCFVLGLINRASLTFIDILDPKTKVFLDVTSTLIHFFLPGPIRWRPLQQRSLQQRIIALRVPPSQDALSSPRGHEAASSLCPHEG